MPSVTDKFAKSSAGTRPEPTTVTVARSIGGTTLDCNALVGWATDTHVDVVTYRKDPTNTEKMLPGSQNDWKAIVSGSQLTSLTHIAGTDNGHEVGDVVVCTPTAGWADALVTGILSHANQNGTLKQSAVLAALGISSTPAPDWTLLPYVPSAVTYLGNRSYQLTYTGQNVTTAMNPGTRNRFTRTVAAPTQCTSLNGTNQYYNKTSPAGMTFTDDFTVGGWIKLSSYSTGSQMIMSRTNGTSGWLFYVLPDGRVKLEAYNAGSANQSSVTSYQSIQLDKWVHVTAQLDMSAFTATTTTSYVMIDCVDVPAGVARAGTNPTSLVQAGNLEVGSYNGGLLPFNGKIAQVFVSSAKITQANICTLVSQSITPALITANNIISAYSFNNSINDLNTTNANNLTAQNSAVATNADSPFGTQASGLISSTLDYGIVQSATFSTDSTVIVQVPEGCTISTSGGISSVDYSGVSKPYGFPGQKQKYRIETTFLVPETVSISAINSWWVSHFTLYTPVGAWEVGYSGTYSQSSSAASVRSGWIRLATTTPTASSYSTGILSSRLYYPGSSTLMMYSCSAMTNVVVTSPVTYSMYGTCDFASGIEVWTVAANNTTCIIYAENAYV